MSFKIIDQAQPRLNRSELAVPGSNPALFEKAANSKVDVIFLDLEDAVAPDEKHVHPQLLCCLPANQHECLVSS